MSRHNRERRRRMPESVGEAIDTVGVMMNDDPKPCLLCEAPPSSVGVFLASGEAARRFGMPPGQNASINFVILVDTFPETPSMHSPTRFRDIPVDIAPAPDCVLCGFEVDPSDREAGEFHQPSRGDTWFGAPTYPFVVCRQCHDATVLAFGMEGLKTRITASMLMVEEAIA